MRYPSREQLLRLGEQVRGLPTDQDALDAIIAQELVSMDDSAGIDPIRIKRRIEEALSVLRALDFPRAQQNERSALPLLALLDLAPEKPWSDASDPLRGITPMMEFFARHYGKHYKPNTRETVRRQTVHQFLDAGIIVANPGDPARGEQPEGGVPDRTDHAGAGTGLRRRRVARGASAVRRGDPEPAAQVRPGA